MQFLEQNRIVLSNLNKVICVCSILLKGWSGRDRQTIFAGWSKRPTHNPPFCPTVLTRTCDDDDDDDGVDDGDDER